MIDDVGRPSMSVFRGLVKKCIVANRAKHAKMRSPHEGLALIMEELEELKEEVFKRKRKEDPFRFLNELVEIAALCEIFAEDLVKVESSKTDGNDAHSTE